MQTPPFIAQYIDPLLQSSGLWFIARLSLAVVFIASGAAKGSIFGAGWQKCARPGSSRPSSSTSRWQR